MSTLDSKYKMVRSVTHSLVEGLSAAENQMVNADLLLRIPIVVNNSDEYPSLMDIRHNSVS